jgi:hypothetical protein
MEIRISTPQVLKILYILSWVIFVGICIDAGAIIFNAVYWLIAKPAAATYLWEKANMLSLYNYDRGYFFVITLIMSIVGVLKALLFYRIIKILHDKKMDMSQPFTKEMQRFIFTVCWLAFGIGLFSTMGENYSGWLTTRGVSMPPLQDLRLAGGDVWLFMGVTLFVIAHIFKRGIEIQAENDLTI